MLTYTYEGWVLDLRLTVKYNAFSRFDLGHECPDGGLGATKGVLKNSNSDTSTFQPSAWTAQCKACHAIMSDAQQHQLTAMWNLVQAMSEV